MMSYKSPMSFENNNIHSQKKKHLYIFLFKIYMFLKKFQLSTLKYPLKYNIYR